MHFLTIDAETVPSRDKIARRSAPLLPRAARSPCVPQKDQSRQEGAQQARQPLRGEQQRVAIARALAMKPRSMLFDEPTAWLDPEAVGEVLSVIRELVREEGMTTLISTHEMGFAREIADRVVIFDNGDIIGSGPPSQIFAHPANQRTRTFLTRVLNKGSRTDLPASNPGCFRGAIRPLTLPVCRWAAVSLPSVPRGLAFRERALHPITSGSAR